MNDPRAALADILIRNGIPFAPLIEKELAERGVLLVTEDDERIVHAICDYGHAFVTHTGRPVSECPMYEEHKRMRAAIFAALSDPAE